MTDIEVILTQFGGAFGGAAGPVRNVASRSSDLIPVAARTAEILHPTLDLGHRVGRLVIRLTYGVPAAVAEIAREAGADLLRGDYCNLAEGDLGEASAIAAADDSTLLAATGGDQKKVTILRAAAERIIAQRAEAAKALMPVLQAYVA